LGAGLQASNDVEQDDDLTFPTTYSHQLRENLLEKLDVKAKQRKAKCEYTSSTKSLQQA
jgi:hypothetical protein